MDKETIDHVKKLAVEIAFQYDAGPAWGGSKAGFIIHRLLEVIDFYEKKLTPPKG